MCPVEIIIFSVLHRERLWLNRARAQEVVACVNLFSSVYVYLAGHFVSEKLCRFHMEPSHHAFMHLGVRVQQSLDANAPIVLSPACWLCENSEDWVGRISRITRRVHARTCAKRTIQRYLIKMFLEFERLNL